MRMRGEMRAAALCVRLRLKPGLALTLISNRLYYERAMDTIEKKSTSCLFNQKWLEKVELQFSFTNVIKYTCPKSPYIIVYSIHSKLCMKTTY